MTDVCWVAVAYAVLIETNRYVEIEKVHKMEEIATSNYVKENDKNLKRCL